MVVKLYASILAESQYFFAESGWKIFLVWITLNVCTNLNFSTLNKVRFLSFPVVFIVLSFIWTQITYLCKLEHFIFCFPLLTLMMGEEETLGCWKKKQVPKG